jgi:hypothetical protein
MGQQQNGKMGTDKQEMKHRKTSKQEQKNGEMGKGKPKDQGDRKTGKPRDEKMEHGE